MVSMRMTRGGVDDRRRVRARRGVMPWRTLSLRLRGIRSLVGILLLLLATMIRRAIQAAPPGHDAPRPLRLPFRSVLVLLRVRVCVGM